MANHQLLRNYIIKLLENSTDLSTTQIYDECKKKYNRSVSGGVINNILGKNSKIQKLGTEKVKSFSHGYHLVTRWGLRDG